MYQYNAFKNDPFLSSTKMAPTKTSKGLHVSHS